MVSLRTICAKQLNSVRDFLMRYSFSVHQVDRVSNLKALNDPPCIQLVQINEFLQQFFHTYLFNRISLEPLCAVRSQAEDPLYRVFLKRVRIGQIALLIDQIERSRLRVIVE